MGHPRHASPPAVTRAAFLAWWSDACTRLQDLTHVVDRIADIEADLDGADDALFFGCLTIQLDQCRESLADAATFMAGCLPRSAPAGPIHPDLVAVLGPLIDPVLTDAPTSAAPGSGTRGVWVSAEAATKLQTVAALKAQMGQRFDPAAYLTARVERVIDTLYDAVTKKFLAHA